MYSRKNSGYPRFTPPPNYNGVAFTRDYMPSSEVKESTPKASDVQTSALPQESEPICDVTVCETLEDTPDESVSKDSSENCEQKQEHPHENGGGHSQNNSTESICTKLIGKELSLEDLLLIGAVILFVSGEFDGDLMLLLGLLLIAGL